jgi:hypothetical protein
MNESSEEGKSIDNENVISEVTNTNSTPIIDSKVEETEEIPTILHESIEDEKSKTIEKEMLLKQLLSVSAATSTTETSLTAIEEMITRTEVTNEQLKLRKIIYQTDNEEKKPESGDGHVDEDDRRLVIAISDDEGSESIAKAKQNIRSSLDERKTSRKSNGTHQQGEK